PFTAVRRGGSPEQHPDGTATGYSGRRWHEVTAALPAARQLTLRWRYTTDRLYVGRGAYVDAQRVQTRRRVLFDESRPADAARLEARGWTASAD
ncbi:serine hydrolase, partial [Streptomyces sp. SID625]|nr:serine hydrolase [Streptomyces sp. SID625]